MLFAVLSKWNIRLESRSTESKAERGENKRVYTKGAPNPKPIHVEETDTQRVVRTSSVRSIVRDFRGVRAKMKIAKMKENVRAFRDMFRRQPSERTAAKKAGERDIDL